MNKSQGLKLSIIVLVASIAIGCTTANTNSTDAPQVSPEGMELKKSTRSTIAYKKEGVDFSEYDKVQILPSTVAFKKNWKRNYNRDQAILSSRVNDDDVIRIKADVAKLFDEVFKDELGKDTKFPIVDKVSSNTLVIRPAIINLDVVAPDVRSAANVQTYANDAGQATLYLEFYDGVSGEILARVITASVAGDNSYNHWATRVSNRADTKRMIRKWAKKLSTTYDENHIAKVN